MTVFNLDLLLIALQGGLNWIIHSEENSSALPLNEQNVVDGLPGNIRSVINRTLKKNKSDIHSGVKCASDVDSMDQ